MYKANHAPMLLIMLINITLLIAGVYLQAKTKRLAYYNFQIQKLAILKPVNVEKSYIPQKKAL